MHSQEFWQHEMRLNSKSGKLGGSIGVLSGDLRLVAHPPVLIFTEDHQSPREVNRKTDDRFTLARSLLTFGRGSGAMDTSTDLCARCWLLIFLNRGSHRDVLHGLFKCGQEEEYPGLH